ncbi:MAG TPA: OadG family transporter subunit [Prolixibacteraceae bacterium]|nr:OadG family transporter subunit [Prolixibacteraceae bacterium]
MMKLRQFITVAGAVFLFSIFSTESGAQSTMDLRINEVLVYNDSNYVDDFGKHSPWIEIFNTAYNKVDIGGLYLTDDLSNPTKYPIAKGQELTKIPPRSYLVFWADNKPTYGILHLNFILEPGKTIALFEGNGKTLIDSLTIPHGMITDISYGRREDGGSVWINLPKTTPNANNNTEPVITAGEEFAKFDPSGGGMTMIAMGVVFMALAALYLFFKMTSKVLAIDVGKQLAARSLIKAKAGKAESADSGQEGLAITGETNAAIAMTLYLYSSELHDAENTVLTINKVSRTYSPWSSKIYGLRKLPK